MIYTIGGIKGGSGKTTVAVSLAILLSQSDRKVLLVDADDQKSATDFTALRNEDREGGAGYTAVQLADKAVRTEIRQLAPNYDDIVIDTGGRDTTSQRAALSVSHVALVPFVPSTLDIWTMEKMDALLGEIAAINDELAAYAFINRADPQGSDNIEAFDFLQESAQLKLLPHMLGNRKPFRNAISQGIAVTELPSTRDNAKAQSELAMLFRGLCALTSTPLSGQSGRIVSSLCAQTEGTETAA